jgi:hypothetical protein
MDDGRLNGANWREKSIDCSETRNVSVVYTLFRESEALSMRKKSEYSTEEVSITSQKVSVLAQSPGNFLIGSLFWRIAQKNVDSEVLRTTSLCEVSKTSKGRPKPLKKNSLKKSPRGRMIPQNNYRQMRSRSSDYVSLFKDVPANITKVSG